MKSLLGFFIEPLCIKVDTYANVTNPNPIIFYKDGTIRKILFTMSRTNIYSPYTIFPSIKIDSILPE